MSAAEILARGRVRRLLRGAPEVTRSVRESLGLTQVELAELLGTGQTSVSRWERGEAVPGPSAIRKLGELLQAMEVVE